MLRNEEYKPQCPKGNTDQAVMVRLVAKWQAPNNSKTKWFSGTWIQADQQSSFANLLGCLGAGEATARLSDGDGEEDHQRTSWHTLW